MTAARILIPVDDCPRIPMLAPLVERFAHQTGADVVLLHLDECGSDTEHPAQACQALDRHLACLRAAGVNTQAISSKAGSKQSPWRTIAAKSAALRPDLIVLAAPPQRGISGTSHALRARVTAQLLAHPATPLLIQPTAPERPPYLSRSRDHPGATVMVTLDGSPFAEQALPLAVAWARALRRPLLLVRVVSPVTLLGGGPLASPLAAIMQAEHEREARRYLRSLRMRLAAEQQLLVQSTLLLGSPATAILRSAEAHEGSVLVKGTHGRGGLARLLMGSVTQRVLQETPLPLLIVPPRGSGSDAAGNHEVGVMTRDS